MRCFSCFCENLFDQARTFSLINIQEQLSVIRCITLLDSFTAPRSAAELESDQCLPAGGCCPAVHKWCAQESVSRQHSLVDQSNSKPTMSRCVQ